MFITRLVKLLIVLGLVAIGALAIGTNISTSASSGVAPNEHSAFPFDARFPGKAQDDLTAPLQSARSFPGKERDDLVTVGNVVDKHFPGKEQDDLAVPHSGSGVNGSLIEDRADRAQRIAVPERYFPGKEKDDLVMP